MSAANDDCRTSLISASEFWSGSRVLLSISRGYRRCACVRTARIPRSSASRIVRSESTYASAASTGESLPAGVTIVAAKIPGCSRQLGPLGEFQITPWRRIHVGMRLEKFLTRSVEYVEFGPAVNWPTICRLQSYNCYVPRFLRTRTQRSSTRTPTRMGQYDRADLRVGVPRW